MKDLDLRNVKVKNTTEVTTEMLNMLRDTQDFGKRYFNEYDYNKEEIQRRINNFEKQNLNVFKYTDGKNIIITVNAKVWDGASILSK